MTDPRPILISRRHLLLLVLLSVVGGAAGAWLIAPTDAHADGKGVLQADQLWIYAADGKHRIQLATYPRGGEKGQPLMGFTDSKARLKLLFRLYGASESPVAVFKDNSGRDRLVIGLRDADQAPFMAAYDAAGKATMVHGKR